MTFIRLKKSPPISSLLFLWPMGVAYCPALFLYLLIRWFLLWSVNVNYTDCFSTVKPTLDYREKAYFVMMVLFIHCVQFANILLKIFLILCPWGEYCSIIFFGIALSCFNVRAMLPFLKMNWEVFSPLFSERVTLALFLRWIFRPIILGLCWKRHYTLIFFFNTAKCIKYIANVFPGLWHAFYIVQIIFWLFFWFCLSTWGSVSRVQQDILFCTFF